MSDGMLEILSEALTETKQDLSTALERIVTLSQGDPSFEEAAENYVDDVQRLWTAAEMMGLEGLQTTCTFVSDNVKVLATQDAAARQKAQSVLAAWPDLVLSYLGRPAENVIPMLNHFREPEWAKPLPDEQAHSLLQQLTQGSTAEEVTEEEEAYQCPTIATPEDVIIEVPEDINPELMEAYLSEAPQHAAEFSECIQSIIQDPQVAEIHRAQRIAHTLKGSSNIIGIKGIANIAHRLEDTLEYLEEKKVAPPEALTNMMVEAADCLESMVDSLTGQGEAPGNAQQIFQDVLDWTNRILKGQMDAPPIKRTVVAPAAKKTQVTETDAQEEKKAAAPATGAPEQVLKVPTRTIDNLMRLVGELSISVGQMQDRIKHLAITARLLTENDFTTQQKTFELENLVDIRGVTGVKGQGDSGEEDEEFDPLEMEEYNELHSVAHSFIESISDSREMGMTIRQDLSVLDNMLVQHERLNREFQNSVMTTRMLPATTIIQKLQRNVRQTSRSTGKKAKLDVHGSDIMVDSDVLNKLADPLMHIIRNAIDHGLEPNDEREILGKSAEGTVKLEFYREGNFIVVSCKDDGQGLNYTNIRYTAIQRGLITETQELSEAELGRLILMSGFSTKQGVTQTSGRGVGMDVVHTNVREMKGTIDLISKTGEGTTILLKLPMSLVTVHVFLARIGKKRFAIPTNSLERALAPGTGELQTIGDEFFLKLGKTNYEIKMLSDLLGISGDVSKVEEFEHSPIVLVHEETRVSAVVIDELMDSRDLVMKSMGQYVAKVRGVAGASILGDGTVVPLLDLPELLRSPMQSMVSSYVGEQKSEDGVLMDDSGAPNIMVVDDSLSVRKSLTLLLENEGFEVLQEN